MYNQRNKRSAWYNDQSEFIFIKTETRPFEKKLKKGQQYYVQALSPAYDLNNHDPITINVSLFS